ncbi:MAG: DUF892 family protein [Parafilimonas sp.]
MAKSSSKKTVSKTSSKPGNKKTSKSFARQFAKDADSSLQDLFVSEIKDTYCAENHLVKALPKVVNASGTADLKQALADYLKVTKNHASRLEKIFELIGEKIIAKKCDAMEELTMSGEHVIENTITGTNIRDVGIIMSALKVENFEIKTYKGLIQVANSLDRKDVANLLQQNLDEEIKASDMLTYMSQSRTLPIQYLPFFINNKYDYYAC